MFGFDVLSSLLGLNGAGKSLTEAAVNVGVSPDTANKLQSALSNNELKSFEKLVAGLLSGSTLNMESKLQMQNLVSLTLDGLLSNSSLQLIVGDPVTSPACFVGLFLVIFALMIKDGVSFFILLCLAAFTILVAAYLLMKQFFEQVSKVKERLHLVTPSLALAVPSAAQSGTSEFVSTLMCQAECGPVVSKDVKICAVNVHALRCMNIVLEACHDTLTALHGKIQKASQTERFGLHSTAGEAAQEIDNMKKSMEQVRKAVDERVDANVHAAEIGTKMEDEVAGLRESLEHDVQQMHRRPEALLLQSEKESRAEADKSRQKELDAFCKMLRKELRDLRSESEELDYRSITKQCSTMIQVLAFSPEVQQEQQKAIQKSIEIQQELSTALADRAPNAVWNVGVVSISLLDLKCRAT